MEERQRIKGEADAVQNAFRGRGDEDADPDDDASKRDSRETTQATSQLRMLLLEEVAPGNVRDEGNAKLQHPAIDQGLRSSRFHGACRDNMSQDQRGDEHGEQNPDVRGKQVPAARRREMSAGSKRASHQDDEPDRCPDM